MLIKGYKRGSNLTIMNNMYHYRHKGEDGKLVEDTMTIVYKNNDTGKKGLEVITNPEYTFYRIKPEYVKPYNQFFIEESKCDPITVPYCNLEREIADMLGMKDFFYDNIRSGNKMANKILHAHPSLMGSDTHINNYYRKIFDREYQNPTIPLFKSYLDIEVDGKYMAGVFPQPGECPINAMSLFNEVNNTLYTFVLKDKNNPLVAEFEQYTQNNDFEKEFIDFLYDNVGGWKKAHKMHLNDIKVKVSVFDDEIKLIYTMFEIINYTQPDFVLAWNMSFDIPYIIERIKNLGYDPKEIMCHPDFEEKHCEYCIDKLHEAEFAQRGDYADISSYSVFMDQLIQFASRRKNQSAFASFGLDYIGGVIAGARKLDYHDLTTDIMQFPYLDFKRFTMYNMMDVMVQKCIEEKTGDIDYVFNKALVNDTMYPKAHRQTVYLPNRVAKFIYEKNGFILGNNCNKFKERPGEKFAGAFVASMLPITDKPKERINGTPSMVVRNANDFDYKRLYPSIMQEFNICPNGQIGRLDIPDKVHDMENRNRNPKYYRATAFLEDLCSGDSLSFCHRWFHLASFMEMYNDVIEYYKTHDSKKALQTQLSRGKRDVLRFYHGSKFTAVELVDPNVYKKDVITIYERMPDYVKVEAERIIKERALNDK